jgi:RNA polymerase sporulation-specific sigma factor
VSAMLSVEVTQELLVKAKEGDDKSKEILLLSNEPLIKSIVKRYLGKGVDYEDLYQLGAMGFVKAINKYDASYGVKFTTYAVPLILGEIKRFLRDDGTIKVSRSVKGLFVKIKKYLASIQDSPTVDEIAQHFEVSREEVIYAMEASHLPLSLFDKVDDGVSLGERIVGDDGSGLIDKIMISKILEDLSDRERKIIVLRYFRNATQIEVARKLMISQVQVSRIEQRVLEKFREMYKKEEII